MDTKELEVLRAVNFVKQCPYKTTAIKVELESTTHREWSDTRCINFLIQALEKYGLSDGSNWKSPITYGRVYYDGSVDTEFTFTLLLNKPENIFLLPKIIEAYNALCAHFKMQEVTGAGMHTALLNDPNGGYRRYSRVPAEQVKCFNNFNKSMQLLLPSLYFLATPDERSRSLSPRIPTLAQTTADHGSEKYYAVSYQGGALEFRIFDTCYQQPLAILDNVVVIANCMQFWATTYIDSGMTSICQSTTFGSRQTLSYKLERLYTTPEHFDLLDKGLEILKPAYYTIEQLKKQRNFNIKKEHVVNVEARLRREAEAEYAEYLERFKWNEKTKYQQYATALQSEYAKHYPSWDRSKILKAIESITPAPQKKSLAVYTAEKLQAYRASIAADYVLKCV
jgi:hypothetical protein